MRRNLFKKILNLKRFIYKIINIFYRERCIKLEDYIGEINFSVKMCKPHTPVPWVKILEKVKGKKKKKKYQEEDYAFGIYQILPNPPELEEGDLFRPKSEFLCK